MPSKPRVKQSSKSRALVLSPAQPSNLSRRAASSLATRKRTRVVTGELESSDVVSHAAACLVIYGRGEPLHEGSCRDARGNPRSLWTAIVRLTPTFLGRIGLAFYGLTRLRDRQSMSAERILYDCQLTDRVSLIQRGRVTVLSVWLDPRGEHRIEVWP